MTYVDRIVTTFGGVRSLARRMGKPSSTVSGWVSRGSMPDDEKAAVLAIAQADGLNLSPQDFFPFERMPPNKDAA